MNAPTLLYLLRLVLAAHLPLTHKYTEKREGKLDVNKNLAQECKQRERERDRKFNYCAVKSFEGQKLDYCKMLSALCGWGGGIE